MEQAMSQHNLIRRFLVSAMLTTAVISSTGLHAGEATITGNAAVRSDYVFRGVSQTDEGLAIQVGAEANTASGLYGGAWVSNVDKPWGGVYNVVGGDEDVEIDLYVGKRFSADTGDYSITGDVGIIRYGFAGDPDDLSWTEAYIGASVGGFSAKISTTIEGAPMGDYVEASYSGNFRELFDYRLHAGHSMLERNTRGFKQYSDYSVGVSKNIKGADLGLTYFRNDKNGDARFLRLSDDRLVFSVSYQRDVLRLDY